MSDITKCTGVNCNIKETCKRYTSESGFRQSYFSCPPVDKNGKCEMYWGVQQESILNALKNIMK